MGFWKKLFGPRTVPASRAQPSGVDRVHKPGGTEDQPPDLIGAARRGNWHEAKRLIRECDDLSSVQKVSEIAKAQFASSASRQTDSLRPLRWRKGEPNPTSCQVIRFGSGTSDSGVLFLCPACLMPSEKLDARITDVTGGLVICDRCGNVSHVPAAYKTQADGPGLAVHGGVRVPIADFGDWMLHHPSFRHADAEINGNYGLWGLCADCHYQYESTVLAMMLPLFDGADVLLTVRSAKSGQDTAALSKRQCPRCGKSDLIAIMVDIPPYVRDAVHAEKKKRGL
jgi:hypothetical protein